MLEDYVIYFYIGSPFLLILFEILAEYFTHRAEKKYFLQPEEVPDPIIIQALCTIDSEKVLLVLTGSNLLIYALEKKGRGDSQSLSLSSITKCKRSFVGNLIICTDANEYFVRVSGPRKWEKLIKSSKGRRLTWVEKLKGFLWRQISRRKGPNNNNNN